MVKRIPTPFTHRQILRGNGSGKVFLITILSIATAFCLALPAGYSGENKNLNDDAKQKKILELFASYAKDLAGVPTVSVESLLKVFRKSGDHAHSPNKNAKTTELYQYPTNYLFIDAREAKEQNVSMIKGAIPLWKVEKAPAKFRNKRLVVYCTIGYRSGIVTRKLRKQGLDAVNLKGGILSWVHFGLPIVGKDGHPTSNLHVYGPTWDLAPKRIHTVW